MKRTKPLIALLLVGLVLILAIRVEPAYAAIPSLVQMNGHATNSSLSFTIAFSSNVVAGHELIVVAQFAFHASPCTFISTPTDSQSNSYTSMGVPGQFTTLSYDTSASPGGCIQAFTATAGSSAADTVTCHFSANGNEQACYIFEVGNQGGSYAIRAVASSGTSVSVSSFTPQVGSLILASVGIDSGLCAAVTPGTGYSAYSPTSACNVGDGLSGQSQANMAGTATTAPMTLPNSAQWGEYVIEIDPLGTTTTTTVTTTTTTTTTVTTTTTSTVTTTTTTTTTVTNTTTSYSDLSQSGPIWVLAVLFVFLVLIGIAAWVSKK